MTATQDDLERIRARIAARTLANLATARRRIIVAGSTDRAVVETHGGPVVDRREACRLLATAQSCHDCGQIARARSAAWKLAQLLRDAGLLPADLDGLGE